MEAGYRAPHISTYQYIAHISHLYFLFKYLNLNINIINNIIIIFYIYNYKLYIINIINSDRLRIKKETLQQCAVRSSVLFVTVTVTVTVTCGPSSQSPSRSLTGFILFLYFYI